MTTLMSSAGLDALKAQIAELEGPARKQIVAEIKASREFGDLAENAEYHEARRAQVQLEAKIATLRQRLATAQLAEPCEGEQIGFGSTVTLRDARKTLTYRLVGAHEADPSAGELSIASPVAVALLGRCAGDRVSVTTPRGVRQLEVISVA